MAAFPVFLTLTRVSRVSCKNILNVAGGSRNIPHPAAKATMCVDSVRPFVKESALGLVLFAVTALGFQYQQCNLT